MTPPTHPHADPEEQLHADFDAAGFLGASVEAGRPYIRAQLRHWFAFTDRLNGVLQQYAVAAHDIAGSKLEARTISGRLMMRSASIFQGVVVLAERGMDLEARVLTRTLLEHAFVLGSMHEDADATIQLLTDDAAFSARARIKTVQKGTDFPEERPALIEALKQLPSGTQPLRPSDMAGRSPLGRLYLIHQTLSNDAAHPSLTSLDRFAHIDGDRWRYQWGPATPSQIADTIEHACTAAISAAVAYANFVDVPIGGEVLHSIVEEFAQLQTV